MQSENDALLVVLWEDDRGFYWRLGEDGPHGVLSGPFPTRNACKQDASAALYITAGKAGLRFEE